MKRIAVLLTFVFSVSILLSQTIDPDLLNDMKARNIGPGGMSGRVTAIAVEPGNSSVFYVGTASGGLWKTTNGGVNFDPIFDDQAVVGIGALAIDPNNPDVIWAGTGEGNPRNSITGGYGLYRSLDAGRTWSLVGLEETRHIHRIIVDPSDGNVVYVGAIGSPWGPHKERGVYKSTDKGESWEQILFVNELTGVADMIIDPLNPDKLFVAMWEHQRFPWFFNSGGKGSGLYMTIDGGKSWNELDAEDGLPKGELGRIGLAISKSNPDYVYAIVESKKNAIYRSDDGGYKWSVRGTENIGDRPFYYADIFVDPENENRLYSLYSNVNVSEDGGNTFSTLVGRNIHSDHHAWWIDPQNPSFMIDGNDGGLAISYDMGKNWRHVTNLPVSQFYHISVDNELPYNVYGGMQDNGSWKGPGYLWSNAGIINEYWDFLLGGDGFDVLPLPGDAGYCYAMSQGGNLRRINTETGDAVNIQPVIEDDIKLRWHWNAALAQDPFDNNTIYYGSQFLHKSSDRGDSWTTISPDLTSNDTSRQHFDKSGGLTYDVTGAETYTCILAIAPSRVKEGVIWVGTDDGNIQLTRDGGKTWTNTSAKIKGFPDRPWIPQIVASSRNDAEAFVVVNNYRQNDYEPYLYHTSDFGRSWKRIVTREDVPGYVLSFVQDPEQAKLMFLGTEFGLYVSINGGEDWEKWTRAYPTVSTMDLVIQEREADLVIGTFGRSAFVLDDIRPLRKWAEQGADFTIQTIQVFDPPVAYMASGKNAPGYYFHGDAYFMGENRRMGAQISFFVKDGASEEQNKKGGGKQDSIQVKIFDADMELVRSLKFVPETGINRMYWNFDMDGINLNFGRNRGRGRGRSNSYPGGGGYVLAGNYKIRMIYQGDSSETVLTVKPDPRVSYDREALIDKQAYLDEIFEELSQFNDKLIQINACQKTYSTIQALAKEQASDTLKAVIKSIGAELTGFKKAFSPENNVQGIFNDDESFLNKVGILRYISYGSGPLSANQRLAVEKARGTLQEMETEIDKFLAEDWADFKKLVEAEDLSLFH